MFLLDTLLIGSLRFVLDKVAAAAEAEMNDSTSLREQLLEAQMRLELGEISDRAFRKIERDLLARIRALDVAEGGQRQPISMASGDRAPNVEVETFKPEA